MDSKSLKFNKGKVKIHYQYPDIFIEVKVTKVVYLSMIHVYIKEKYF